MRLKLSGNPQPGREVVEYYKRAAMVAFESDLPGEEAVGKAVLCALGDAFTNGDNATDMVMTVLAEMDAATRRIRDELRGIHS